ncbi:MAG: hypothetical protein FWE33_07720 [Defluviitaleaceae bacterium]|nr:hypothetical protein [Defluviitaleaceae bacterium]
MKKTISIDHGNRLIKAETYKAKFAHYFTKHKDVIRFELNGRQYAIQIVDCHVFTVDALQLNNFKPNMTLCASLYWGVNTLFQSINDQVRSTGARDISESIIEEILKSDPSALSEYSQKRIEIIITTAKAHVNRMLAEIEQKGFDLIEDRTVFMGGGSILLKDYILQTGKVGKPIFIDDIHANAKGYRLLYDMQNGNNIHNTSNARVVNNTQATSNTQIQNQNQNQGA